MLFPLLQEVTNEAQTVHFGPWLEMLRLHPDIGWLTAPAPWQPSNPPH